jgi:hypothetical protein
MEGGGNSPDNEVRPEFARIDGRDEGDGSNCLDAIIWNRKETYHFIESTFFLFCNFSFLLVLIVQFTLSFTSDTRSDPPFKSRATAKSFCCELIEEKISLLNSVD